MEVTTVNNQPEEKEKMVWDRMANYGVPLKIILNQFPLSPSLTKFIPPKTGVELSQYRGPYFFGASGTGKTTGAVMLVYEWLKQFKQWPTWAFINYPKFIMELQDTFRGKDSAYDFIDTIAQKTLLVIDDLGAEKPTEYVRQATYYLINEREANCLPTIITSNFSLDYLESNIDPRIASRIKGMCELVEMKGRDLRIKRT